MDLCDWARDAMDGLDASRSTSNGSPAAVSLDQLRLTELGSRVERAKDCGPKAVKYGIWDTASGVRGIYTAASGIQHKFGIWFLACSKSLSSVTTGLLDVHLALRRV